jgi:RNA polymerase sigma-70 factor (ECF subfamily)
MRISERRQGAERPALLPQCREKIPPSGPRPTLATAILPNCLGNKLVYAVYKATESEERVSDELLLKSVAEGDKAAMHIMFARHRVRVFRFIQRMVRNAAIADDLVSQVFLDVWRSANRFEGRARVSTWLLSIARLKALSSLRQRTYENIDQDDVVGIVDAGDTPEVALDRKTTNAILRSCIDKLSPAQREIIDLVYYHEKSVAEVSEIVGIPYATVKSRMFYARKQLARMLVSVGFEAAAVRTNVANVREARPSRGSHLKLRAG